MKTHKKTRFEKRLDLLFWFIISLLPIAIYLFQCWNNTPAITFFDFLATFSPFDFITNILNQLTLECFSTTFALNSFIGYVVGVELVHIFFDVIVFIPRLCHKWISIFVQD